MRLGPEHRADLVDPLEHADHRLLVELRRLGQVRRPAEVVEREHVRAALGRRRDDLRACGSRRSRPRPVWTGTRPPRPRRAGTPAWPRRVAQRDRRVVEQGRQGGRRAWAGTGRTAAARRGAEHVVPSASISSTPPGAVGWRRPCRSTSTTVSSASSSSWRAAPASVTTTWASPARVPHDQERHRLEQPAAVDPAGDRDGLADWAGAARWTGCVALVVPPLSSQRDPQGGVGERDPRGATTPSPPRDGRPLVAVRGSGGSSRPRRQGPPSQLPAALSAGGAGALLGSVVALDRTLTPRAQPVSRGRRNVSRRRGQAHPGTLRA